MIKNGVFVMLLAVTPVVGIVGCGDNKDEGTVAHEDGGPPSWWTGRDDLKEGVPYGFGQGTGISKVNGTKLARQSAIADAQADIARFISSKVQSLFEEYMKDAATGDAAEASRMTESATRTIVNQRLTGFKIEKEGTDKANQTYYVRAYLDYAAVANLGDAYKNSADINKALDKVKVDKEAFFKKLDEKLDAEFGK